MLKGKKKYMNKLKGSILINEKKGGENTSNAGNGATSSTTRATSSSIGAITRFSDTYISGIGIGAVLAIGACVFFTYNNKSSQLQIMNKPRNNSNL